MIASAKVEILPVLASTVYVKPQKGIVELLVEPI